MSDPGTIHDARVALDRRSMRVALATIGPRRRRGLDVLLRRARLADGPAWRLARLGDLDRLRPALGDDCSLVDWADHVLAQRRAIRAGTLVPFLAVEAGGRVVGECSFAVDGRSGGAECSLWTAAAASPPVATWILASTALRMMELPQHVPFVTAPTAATNPGPSRLMAVFGFEQVALSRQLRPYDGVPTDHVVWRLDNTPVARDRLRALATT